MDIQTTLKRDPELLAVDMDGETVSMDMESGDCFGVYTVGSHIWEALEALIQLTISLKSVKRTQCKMISLLFLNDMLEQKLVEVVSP